MDIYDYLTEKKIEFERFDHPPVYTCEEAQRLIPEIPGASTKNLFLRNKKGDRHFLVVVPEQKRVELKVLSETLGSNKLSMGSAERLSKHLGIEPGSVSLLSLVNDREHKVELILDESLWQETALKCHPLINSSTLVIPHAGIEKFIESSGHTAMIIDVPEQQS